MNRENAVMAAAIMYSLCMDLLLETGYGKSLVLPTVTHSKV